MPLDPNKLSRNELVQLLNSTSLGECLTRGRLNSQMNRSGRRWHDGRNIRLLDYLRWLVRQVERPAKPQIDGRAADLARKNTETWRSQNVAPVPDIVEPTRRQQAVASFRVFCETYFAAACGRPWSEDHLRVIQKIERAVKEGGLFAFAMPRGSGKTTLACLSALWAVLGGYRPFVCLIGGSQERAIELLTPIRKAILGNPLLLADFPKAVHPLRRLQNNARRQIGQHIDGQPTYCTWAADKLVFPTVEGSESSGAIIAVTSLDANIRGQQHARVDGSIIRPSLVLLDDPQTRESARSSQQTRKRLELLNGDVLGMAGPGQQLAALMTCTKIYARDLAEIVLDRERSPEWDGECTRLVHSFPTDARLWEEYAEVRRTQGKSAGNEFYRARRGEMDAGAKVAWPQRYDDQSGEISAIQHAMNLRLKVGPEAFAAEYQNDPLIQQLGDEALTVDQVMAKVNGYQRGEVPPSATKLTMFIDIHDRLLFYAVCAWEEDFTGYVLDYGTFPGQRRPVFTLADAPDTLGRQFPGTGVDGAIHAGLSQLVKAYLGREWKRAGGLMQIGRLLADMGYKPAVVEDVKRRVGGAVMLLAKGVGIRASRKPIAEYARRPGETIGHYWYIPNVRHTGQFPHVLVDVNYWKSFIHTGLATAPGDQGCISLFGNEGRQHELFAEHVAGSEQGVEVIGPGGLVREWSWLPSRPDNHWLDCLVGCAAAASMLGVKTPGQAVPDRPRKRMLTQADFTRK